MVLLTVACLPFCLAGYSQPVNLSVKRQPLETVFREIKSQTGYVFWYKLEILQYARKVTLHLENQDLAVVLTELFKDQPLSYEIIDRTIAVKLKEEVVLTPPVITVTGKIADDKGLPLAGVTVMVEGASGGVTTDAEGVFHMSDLKQNAVLVFSSVGFQTQEVRLAGRESISVVLHTESQSLEDMVVVGYARASRKDLSGAVSSIGIKSQDLNKGAITDVGQLLQGKVPGLNITASGDPNKPAAIILRGASSINSPGGPFYVIDGVPGADISLVAPDDIATIDVLKDAAATAIYGNRAANGLIMITTRRGKKGQVQVVYNGYVGTERVSSRLQVMDAPELRAVLAKNNMAFAPVDDKGANTDWQKEIERNTAVSTNHNLSISGGSEHTTYSASINYAKKEGIIKNTDLTRVIGRLGIDQYVFNDRVKFSLNVTNSSSDADQVPYLGVILLQAAHYLPVSPVKNPDGTYFENKGTGAYYNPVAMMNHSQMNDKKNNLVGSFNTEVKLLFGLTYDINLSYQHYPTLHGEYYDAYFTSNYNNMYNNPDPGLGGRAVQTFGPNGQAYRSYYENTSKLLETFFTWDRHFGDHTIKALLGYSWQDNLNNNGFQSGTYNFPVDNTSYNNFSLSAPYAITGGPNLTFGPDGLYQQTRLISDYVRVNYNLKDKYLIQGSIRRDGSSVFGANHQWGYFPALSAAWRISKEKFMSGLRIFDELKVRGGYGVAGNAFGFNAYTAQTFSGLLGTFYSNGSQVNAYGLVQAANPDLQWEQTATTDIGVDFSILKGRLGGYVDVYDKHTTKMIFNYPMDPFDIFTRQIIANGGGVDNRGIELMLTARPVISADFSWTTTGNVSHNVNKITSLNNPLFPAVDSIPVAEPDGTGQSGVHVEVLKAGKPLGQFFTLQYRGKSAGGISQYANTAGKPDTAATMPGVNYHYAGDAQPRLIYGWNNTFRYKRFDLNIFVRGVYGNKIFNVTRSQLFNTRGANTTNVLKDAANESINDKNVFLYSDRFIESGSYLRLDNATLGYNFRGGAPYVKTIRAYATVNNLFVITGYKGIDPEINQGGVAPGVDYNNFYPRTRTFLLGLSVSF